MNEENRFLSIENSFLLEDREMDEGYLLVFEAFLLVKIEFCLYFSLYEKKMNEENRFLSIEYSFLLEDREVDKRPLLIFEAFLLLKIEFC